MTKIVKVETKPEFSDAWGVSHTALEINPGEREVYVTQEFRNNSTSMRQYNGIDLSLPIAGHPDEQQVRNYLEGHIGQVLLQAICDGHEIIWNGNNHVGGLTDDARLAIVELEFDLQNLPDKYQFWQTEEWLGDFELEDFADLEALAEELEQTAKFENIILDEPILQYLLAISKM